MAFVRGVKERVHLPLYDSLRVRPRQQLREVASAGVLRFFVDVQGKTKLETNMQSSSLLPHWNTFEARALRVVLSDLPVAFPEVVEECRASGTSGPTNGGGIPRPGEALEDFARVEAALRPDSLAPVLTVLRELEAARAGLLDILGRTTIRPERPAPLERLRRTLEEAPSFDDVEGPAGRLSRAGAELEAIRQALEACVGKPLPTLSPAALRQCLLDRLQDPLRLPTDDQLAGRLERIFSTLIYNSVTTFSVGEKTMIQMPTWFFPAGAGVWSEDSRSITHGVPTPQATFRFAEPVVIDTQQNFRVEIEIPERDSLAEIQRLYGPLFLWVVLDGFMVRDVQ